MHLDPVGKQSLQAEQPLVAGQLEPRLAHQVQRLAGAHVAAGLDGFVHQNAILMFLDLAFDLRIQPVESRFGGHGGHRLLNRPGRLLKLLVAGCRGDFLFKPDNHLPAPALLQPGVRIPHQQRKLRVGGIDLFHLLEQVNRLVIAPGGDLPADGIQQIPGLRLPLGLIRLFCKNVAQRKDSWV